MQKFVFSTQVSIARFSKFLARGVAASATAEGNAVSSRWHDLLCDDEGVLTFEWIMLLTLLVIGVVGGLAGIRDAIIHESQSVVGAVISLDQSYSVVAPLGVCALPISGTDPGCTSGGSSSSFRDSATWSAGRTNVTAIDQTVAPNTALCPVL